MTDRKAIEALIEESYNARKKGNVEDLMSAFHPEAVFELVGSKATLAVAGVSGSSGRSNDHDWVR
ncbi:hypothetical protein V1282_004092 [Nitrobacteraceae bacterium AZCC 2146]